jgi:dihydroxy-acid dehydratase
MASDRLNQISDETPVAVDLMAVGEGYMKDFPAACGMGALLRELKTPLQLDTIDVTGRTLARRLADPIDRVDRRITRAFDAQLSEVGGLPALTGALAPGGAIVKRAAATPARD